MATIKADATLLDMVVVPEQQEHLKGFIEGKILAVANLITEEEDEALYDNKVLVVTPSRHSIRNPPFYVSMKIMDKIAHCCLIDGGSGQMLCLRL
jgi:hypothetical protein